MRVERKDGSKERQVLTAMIVNTRVCGRLAAKWPADGLFASDTANLVGKWCVKYYRKYGKAPKKNVQYAYAAWAEDAGDKDQVKQVDRFLGGLSGEYQRLRKEVNPEYVLDQAQELIDEVQVKRLEAAIRGDRDAGHISEAVARIARFGRIDISSTALVDVLQDRSLLDETFGKENDVLFRLPGALGRFFGDSLEREGFVAFLAPQKRGKSWALQHLAWVAMVKHLKVAYFQCGDLSRRQMMKRFYTRAVGRPLKATPDDKPVLYPISLEVSGEDDNYTVTVVPEEKEYKKPVTKQEMEAALDKVVRRRRLKDSFLKLGVYPTRSLTVNLSRQVLQDYEAESGWAPDVIVYDYADILAPPPGWKGESRDAVNENWMELRRLSQERHCLVLTATQAKATSYTAQSLGMEHFSEDNRKFSHVTGMVGINQIDTEKVHQVQRLNWLVLREDEFLTSRHVYTAGCLAIANPYVLSCYPR